MTTLAEKVAFLSNPGVYPRETREVDAVETHMSWVFLTVDRAYKLKKPVRYPHLDYSTLGKRRNSCAEELRLNRRLAPNVYLAVTPLRQSGESLTLGGSGQIVDWLLEMARLPEGDMLDARIASGRVDRAEIDRVGEQLARFYAALPPEPQDADAYVARLGRTLRLDRDVLCRAQFALGPLASDLLDAAEAELERAASEIRERARRGMLVEGHGDLRPEHVCLTEPPQIFDCLEFDRAHRVLDPYDDVAYLGLECAMLGADWIGPALVDRIALRLGDPPSRELLACYGAFAALRRARLSLAHLLETPVRMEEKWRPLAARYLAAAETLLSPRAPEGRQAARRH